MTILKHMLLIFFVGLGVHRFVQDALGLIDAELVSSDAGYFSVIGFMAVYFTVRRLKQRNDARSAKTK